MSKATKPWAELSLEEDVTSPNTGGGVDSWKISTKAHRVGRAPECETKLDSTLVSALHGLVKTDLQIVQLLNGRVVFRAFWEDCSTNGTFVDGKTSMKKGETTELKHDVLIRLSRLVKQKSAPILKFRLIELTPSEAKEISQALSAPEATTTPVNAKTEARVSAPSFTSSSTSSSVKLALGALSGGKQQPPLEEMSTTMPKPKKLKMYDGSALEGSIAKPVFDEKAKEEMERSVRALETNLKTAKEEKHQLQDQVEALEAALGEERSHHSQKSINWKMEKGALEAERQARLRSEAELKEKKTRLESLEAQILDTEERTKLGEQNLQAKKSDLEESNSKMKKLEFDFQAERRESEARIAKLKADFDELRKINNDREIQVVKLINKEKSLLGKVEHLENAKSQLLDQIVDLQAKQVSDGKQYETTLGESRVRYEAALSKSTKDFQALLLSWQAQCEEKKNAVEKLERQSVALRSGAEDAARMLQDVLPRTLKVLKQALEGGGGDCGLHTDTECDDTDGEEEIDDRTQPELPQNECFDATQRAAATQKKAATAAGSQQQTNHDSQQPSNHHQIMAMFMSPSSALIDHMA